MAPFFALGGRSGPVGPNNHGKGSVLGGAKQRVASNHHRETEKVTSSSSKRQPLRKPVRNFVGSLAAASGCVAFVAVASDKPNKKAVAFFDLDHTILDCNSNKRGSDDHRVPFTRLSHFPIRFHTAPYIYLPFVLSA